MLHTATNQYNKPTLLSVSWPAVIVFTIWLCTEQHYRFIKLKTIYKLRCKLSIRHWMCRSHWLKIQLQILSQPRNFPIHSNPLPQPLHINPVFHKPWGRLPISYLWPVESYLWNVVPIFTPTPTLTLTILYLLAPQPRARRSVRYHIWQ